MRLGAWACKVKREDLVHPAFFLSRARVVCACVVRRLRRGGLWLHTGLCISQELEVVLKCGRVWDRAVFNGELETVKQLLSKLQSNEWTQLDPHGLSVWALLT